MAILEKLERELNLKQLQIKSLLTITQAINDNVAASGLFNMYKSFLSWEMGVGKMALYIRAKDGGWRCATNIQYEPPNGKDPIANAMLGYKRLHTIRDKDPKPLREFDIIIPVYHKDQPIAFALIGGIREKEDLYNRIQFITTITNIIAVAIENKRLFKQQLKQERLSKEMELASEVQKMLIPDELPSGKGFELSSIYKPHFNVGGDYIDFIRFTESKFAICIADVSGKGVAAALLMANFQALLQSLIYQYRDLETFIIALNEAVLRITKSDRFLTFFIGEVDLDKMELRYINAGHYPPLLIRKDETIRLSKGCTLIGCFEKLPEIEEGVEKLTPGAIILTFTDGLIDMINEQGEHFNGDRLIETVSAQNGQSATEFNEGLLNELESFSGEQSFPDDIAILTCRITKGLKESNEE